MDRPTSARFAIGAYVLSIVAWFFYIESALLQDYRTWFLWLFSTRVAFAVIAVANLFLIITRRSYLSFSTYAALVMMVQASFGVLEPSHEIFFYQYVPMLLLFNTIGFHKPSLKIWSRKYLVVTALATLVPLYFKDASGYSSLGEAVFTYTLPLTLFSVATLVLFLNVSRAREKDTTARLSKEILELRKREFEAEREIRRRVEEELEQARKDLATQEIYKAIAQTSQMMAHDVRKPFTLVQGLLKLLSNLDDYAQAKQLAIRFIPEVEDAIASVNAMIADVMEVGSDAQLEVEPVDPRELVNAALKTSFAPGSGEGASVERSFCHTRRVRANSRKVVRVLVNLVENAVQAMGKDGKLWIRTIDRQMDGKDFVEFLVGNTGSTISKSDLDRLFDPFFTKGKKEGTGLGLAIVKKIVVSHGGWIDCRSLDSSGVEFRFVLPS